MLKECVIVLLAKIELFFFLVADMGLCLEFLIKTVLIREGCFCTAKQCLHSPCLSSPTSKEG